MRQRGAGDARRIRPALAAEEVFELIGPAFFGGGEALLGGCFFFLLVLLGLGSVTLRATGRKLRGAAGSVNAIPVTVEILGGK